MSKKKAKKKTTPKKSTHSYAKLFWLLSLAGIIAAVALFVLIAKTQLPETSELENPQMEIATQILAEDGRELGKAFKLNREWMTFEEINPYVVDALVSTEDERFWTHSGIDARGTLRAFAYLGKKGGASTITQQLAKLFFTQRSRSLPKRIWQKMKEWTIAIQFEKRYTKEEILAMYLNKYDFLYSAVGISSAAKTYFGKNQSQLTVDEAAVLVGMLKNPSIYNPKKYMENAVKRRNVVMMQMVKNDYLDRSEYDKLKQLPIDVSGFKREAHHDGIAPYFRATVIKDVRKILREDKYLKPDGTNYNIYTDGLKIFTTIDMDMQKHAEAAAKEHMAALQEKYFNRWDRKDPWKYEANEAQRKQRQADLNRQVRESGRFKLLRSRYMNSVVSKLSADIEGVRLWDTDIFRLFTASKNEKHLDKLVRNKSIKNSQAKVYRKILDSKYWPQLKKQWLALQKESKKAFSTKRKMKVFAHGGNGEKTVTMTPMDSIRYHNQQMQIGSVSVDPKTGYVKTWVGGIGHKYFQYDHVKSNRQVGSTFKPFIYSKAIIDLAISPCTKVQDVQYSIPANDPKFGLMNTWAPSNANGKFTGEYMTIKEGLKQSKNSISLYLMKEIGNTQEVRKFASDLGIPKEKIPNAPSICLGVPELNTMDLAGAYTAFADNGTYHKPLYISRIEDRNGKVIYVGRQSQRKAIHPAYNFVMIDMLKNAASFIKYKYGFASEVAGKTGTTNDYRDGWFVGVTPDLVTATWVGGDREWIRFYNLADGQGGVMARPFFSKFLQRLEADPKVNYDKTLRFDVPENQVVELDCSKHEELQVKEILEEPTVDEDYQLDDELELEELDIDE